MYKKFEDAYKTHSLPLLREIHKEYADDDEASIIEEDKQTKELKLQKGLKELEQVLSVLLTSPEQVKNAASGITAVGKGLLGLGSMKGGLMGLTPKSKKDSSKGDGEDLSYLKPSPNIASTQRSRRLDSLATPSARVNKRFGTMVGGFGKG